MLDFPYYIDRLGPMLSLLLFSTVRNVSINAKQEKNYGGMVCHDELLDNIKVNSQQMAQNRTRNRALRFKDAYPSVGLLGDPKLKEWMQ